MKEKNELVPCEICGYPVVHRRGRTGAVSQGHGCVRRDRPQLPH